MKRRLRLGCGIDQTVEMMMRWRIGTVAGVLAWALKLRR